MLTPRTREWHFAIRATVATLLLVAALLKLDGLGAAPYSGSVLSHPLGQACLIFWEVGLGLWLVSGKEAVGAWSFGLLTFSAFAIFSLTQALAGKVTCACFGRVLELSPWLALAIDLGVILLLLAFRPNLSWVGLRTGFTGGMAILAVGVGLVGGLVFVANAAFGSTGGGIAWLRDESLSFEPTVVDFGVGHGGRELETVVLVRNWTSEAVRLIGGSTDCTCLTTLSLPQTIPPGEAKSISIRLKLPPLAGAGRLSRFVEIWTDCDRQRTIRMPVTCRIQGP